MSDNLHTQLETYGTTSDDARWQARDIHYEAGGMMRFRVFRDGREWGEFRTPLIGEFNVRNCLAVIVAADVWGVERAAMQDALATFKSVRRRMEVRGRVRGVTVIDDFAHHPTAVGETLHALRAKYPEGRIFAVFEPRSATSRLALFQSDYVRALGQADYVVVATVFNRGRAGDTAAAAPPALLDTDQLADEIAAQGTTALCIDGTDEIVRRLAPELRAGDVVAVMSNGGFGGIHQKLLDALAMTVVNSTL